MKSNKQDQKLRLDRETVRAIDTAQLGDVAGGTSYSVSRVLKLCVPTTGGGGTTAS